jgi:hypothetical protein
MIGASSILLPYIECLNNYFKKNKGEDGRDKEPNICRQYFYSFSSCFASGMLLSMSLIHTLPETASSYQEYLA